MNLLYQMLNGPQMPNPNFSKGGFSAGGPQFANPMQKMAYIMQAMTNPAAFVRQKFPDIPNEITNNPGQILQFLQQTRGITDAQVQAVANQIPRF